MQKRDGEDVEEVRVGICGRRGGESGAAGLGAASVALTGAAERSGVGREAGRSWGNWERRSYGVGVGK